MANTRKWSPFMRGIVAPYVGFFGDHQVVAVEAQRAICAGIAVPVETKHDPARGARCKAMMRAVIKWTDEMLATLRRLRTGGAPMLRC
jgi:hypothetical protein